MLIEPTCRLIENQQFISESLEMLANNVHIFVVQIKVTVFTGNINDKKQ